MLAPAVVFSDTAVGSSVNLKLDLTNVEKTVKVGFSSDSRTEISISDTIDEITELELMQDAVKSQPDIQYALGKLAVFYQISNTSSEGIFVGIKNFPKGTTTVTSNDVSKLIEFTDPKPSEVEGYNQIFKFIEEEKLSRADIAHLNIEYSVNYTDIISGSVSDFNTTAIVVVRGI